MPVDGALFREALGHWASGVTIVTARHGDHVHGMTVSAFSSVSLEPPLILVCAEKTSNTNGVIEQGNVFCVNVLAQGQDELSNKFASKKYEDVRFEGLVCEDGATGCPHIPGAAVTLDCSVTQKVDAGDHFVYIGRVDDAAVSERDPLVYHKGAYRKLA